MKAVQKNNFLEEFIRAYDEELLELPNSSKLIYVSNVNETSKDNYVAIKNQADTILDWLPTVFNINNHIILEEDIDNMFVEFKQYSHGFGIKDYYTLFKIYDCHDDLICIVKMPSILDIATGGLHEDLIEIQVVQIIDNEIKGLKNKYNNQEMLTILNKTKQYVDELYNKIGLKNSASIRNISVHNVIKFNMYDSLENYYNSCLYSSFFKGDGTVPLLLSMNDNKAEYNKRFFEEYHIKEDISIYLNNIKDLYQYCNSFIELGVNLYFFRINNSNYNIQLSSYIEMRVNDEDFYDKSFSIMIKENLNLNNFKDEYIYINDEQSNIFTIKNFFEDRDEMFLYLKTIQY